MRPSIDLEESRPAHPAGIIVLALLWSGLKHEEPFFSLEKMGRLIDIWQAKGNTFQDLEKIVLKALYGSGWFPDLQKFCDSLEEGKPATAE